MGITSDFFANGVLGGSVSVVSSGNEVRGRVIDLQKNTIPYIRSDNLSELGLVLDEVSEWLHPLRKKLLPLTRELEWEKKWPEITSLNSEIKDAFSQYEEKLKAIQQKRPEWTLRHETVFNSVVQRDDGSPQAKNILSMLAKPNSRLGPWIPFWRLKAGGGTLDWTRIEPAIGAPQGVPFMTWLCPGTWGGQSFTENVNEADLPNISLNLDEEYAFSNFHRMRQAHETHPELFEMLKTIGQEPDPDK